MPSEVVVKLQLSFNGYLCSFTPLALTVYHVSVLLPNSDCSSTVLFGIPRFSVCHSDTCSLKQFSQGQCRIGSSTLCHFCRHNQLGLDSWIYFFFFSFHLFQCKSERDDLHFFTASHGCVWKTQLFLLLCVFDKAQVIVCKVQVKKTGSLFCSYLDKIVSVYAVALC